MSCTCESPIYKSKVTAADDSGGTYVLLTPTDSLTPSNTDKVSLFVTSIDSISPTFAVYVTLNGAAVPVLDKYGNIVYGNSLRTRICLRGYYGTNGNATNTTHLQLVNYPFGR